MKSLLTCLVFAMLVSTGAAQTGFTGVWLRDDRRSDDAEEKVDAAVTGLIEKVSRGRRTREEVDSQVVKQLRKIVDTFVQYADELDVELDGEELYVEDSWDRLRIFYLDGMKHKRQMPNGVTLETVAIRTGNRIEIHAKTSDKAEIFETYVLSSDGTELSLVVRLKDKQLKQPLVIHNTYVLEP